MILLRFARDVLFTLLAFATWSRQTQAETDESANDAAIHTLTISDAISPGNSAVQFTTEANTFTAPKITTINETVFQWWWFSGISTDAQTSIVAIFFTSAEDAFPFTGHNGSTSVQIQVRGPNGAGAYIMPVDTATFTWGSKTKAGVQGAFKGPNHDSEFQFTPSLDAAGVALNGIAIDGNPVSLAMNYTASAPAHYPCSDQRAAGQSLEIFDGIGWTNAMPYASVDALVTVNNTELKISSGMGYSDQNWGSRPFLAIIKNWYWGHTTLGQYTIVFFDGIDSAGNEQTNAYVAKNGKILLSTCKAGAVRARPVGKQSVWPPTPKKFNFNHLAVQINLDSGETLAVNLTHTHAVATVPSAYHRWIGKATGGVIGGQVYDGPAEFEEFTFS